MNLTDQILGVAWREKSFGQRLKFGLSGGKFVPLGPRTIFLGRPNIECTYALFGRAIAAHRGYSFGADGYKTCLCPDSRSGIRRLSPGMAASYNNAIKLVFFRSGGHIRIV